MLDRKTDDNTRIALWAGLLYLIIIVLGISGEVALRGPQFAAGDPAQTGMNILANPVSMKLAFLFDTIMALADVALAVLLFVLFAPISRLLASLAAVFRLAQMAVISGNLMNHQAAIGWMEAGSSLPGLSTQDASLMAYQALAQHSLGYDFGLIFFAANSVLMGILLIRSTAFPRFSGQLLIAAGAVYLTGSLIRFLAPSLAEAFAPAYLVPVVAEVTVAVLLVTYGRRAKRISGRAVAA